MLHVQQQGAHRNKRSTSYTRRRKREISVHVCIQIRAYLAQSLDIFRIATEGPETAYAEEKQCTYGVSGWGENQAKTSDTYDKVDKPGLDVPGQVQAENRYGVRLANGRARGVWLVLVFCV